MHRDTEAIHEVARENRLRAADLLAGLSPGQWRTPSLCAGWTVREVAGHLVETLESRVGVPGLVWALVRHRGSLDRMVDSAARRSAARPPEELAARLRELAGTRLDPPVIGPLGPMTDSLVHLRDMARPLGLDVDAPPDQWRLVLDVVVVPTPVTRGLVPRGRTDGLRFVATDQHWSHGEGAELRGSSEALAMAVTGRPVALADLEGPGVAVLGERLGAQDAR